MTNRWQQYKEKHGTTPLDLLNPKTKLAGEGIAEVRYNMCLKCPELISATKQCKKCGCFMALKTKLADSKCPLGNW